MHTVAAARELFGGGHRSIFLREVQETWPSVGPYLDSRVTAGARSVGLRSDPEYLAGLLAGPRHARAALRRCIGAPPG